MPRQATITLVGGTWTELTNADVTAATVQNQANSPVKIMVTTGSAPANEDGHMLLRAGEGFSAERTLAQLFPGVALGDRIWAFHQQDVKVSISHA